MITIDIETKSDKDISKCGVYAYIDTPYFAVCLFHRRTACSGSGYGKR